MENLMSENEILAAVRKVREMVLQYPARRNHGASPLHYELLHPSRRPCPSLQAGAISPEGVCLAPSPIANGHVLAESNDESWLASSASSSSTHRLPSAISKMELKIGEASPLLLHELIFLLIETLPPQTILALRFVQEGQKTAG